MTIDTTLARTDEERTNLDTVRRWERIYNQGDYDRFVQALYDPEFTVWFTGMRDEPVAMGIEAFSAMGRRLFELAPGIRVSVTTAYPCGDVVTVESMIRDERRPGFTTRVCSVLTFRDGMIIQERSYLDLDNYPGMAALRR
jgi:ketosteroid isomerase-like protein